MRSLLRVLTTLTCILSGGCALGATSQKPEVDMDGRVQVPAYSLPVSSLLRTDVRDVLARERVQKNEQADTPNPCPSAPGAGAAHMREIRKCQADAFYRTPEYKHLRQIYPVVVSKSWIGGIYTEVFTPVDRIEPRNAARVLINVHGGGFQEGARTESHTESVPIAAIAKIKVISVDYRLAPEYAFPSASEDVVKVYRELLKTYKPQNIGIYGCSAGALLTAEVIAWLEKENLALPGAIGMLCEGAVYWTEGDSGLITTAHGSWEAGDAIGTNPYFKGTNPDDPLAFPARSAQVMAKFPPSLLIAGTRDVALSSVVYTHALLVARGVEAELHIWEGVGHAFFFDPDLPLSREVYSVTARFFDKHLGT